MAGVMNHSPITVADIESVVCEFIRFHGHAPTTVKMTRRAVDQIKSQANMDGELLAIMGMNVEIVESNPGVAQVLVESPDSAQRASYGFCWTGPKL